MAQSKSSISLRTHLIWILIIKLLVIVGLRFTFFPPMEEEHLPVDIYFDQKPHIPVVKESQ